jgi:SAM-dependent methyltransferase
MAEGNEIRETVRRHYASLASGVSAEVEKADISSGCCDLSADVSCGCNVKIYDGQMLEGLPSEVTGLSLGCGDPVTIASLRLGERVLDLGSGAGIDCFLAARQVGEEGYVIGVDMTPEMVAKANANKERLGVRQVEFRLGYIEALPLEDNSVDVVMSNCVINLSPDKRAVFSEAFRVLKPGGRLSISDIVTEGDFSPEARSQMEGWVACITGAIDVEQYVGLMRDAGFIDVQIASKSEAEASSNMIDGPRIFSARFTAYKPIPTEKG